MTMIMLLCIFVGSITLIITTIIDSIYMRRNQTWTIFKNQAWPILRVCLLSVSLVAFMSAMFMAFQ